MPLAIRASKVPSRTPAGPLPVPDTSTSPSNTSRNWRDRGSQSWTASNRSFTLPFASPRSQRTYGGAGLEVDDSLAAPARLPVDALCVPDPQEEVGAVVELAARVPERDVEEAEPLRPRVADRVRVAVRRRGERRLELCEPGHRDTGHRADGVEVELPAPADLVTALVGEARDRVDGGRPAAPGDARSLGEDRLVGHPDRNLEPAAPHLHHRRRAGLHGLPRLRVGPEVAEVTAEGAGEPQRQDRARDLPLRVEPRGDPGALDPDAVEQVREVRPRGLDLPLHRNGRLEPDLPARDDAAAGERPLDPIDEERAEVGREPHLAAAVAGVEPADAAALDPERRGDRRPRRRPGDAPLGRDGPRRGRRRMDPREREHLAERPSPP